MSNNILTKAINLAIKAHSAQVRDDGVPYHTHLFRVMERLITIGITDPNILAAAVMHDLIEDTYVSYGELAKDFGSYIANIVRELSADTRKTKEERKEEELQKAKRMSAEATIIKVADILDNLNDMSGWTNQRKEKYIKEKQEYYHIFFNRLHTGNLGNLNDKAKDPLLFLLDILIKTINSLKLTL